MKVRPRQLDNVREFQDIVEFLKIIMKDDRVAYYWTYWMRRGD